MLQAAWWSFTRQMLVNSSSLPLYSALEGSRIEGYVSVYGDKGGIVLVFRLEEATRLRPALPLAIFYRKGYSNPNLVSYSSYCSYSSTMVPQCHSRPVCYLGQQQLRVFTENEFHHQLLFHRLPVAP